MNETKTETRRKARRFSEEFKQDAVRLVVSEEYIFKAAAAVGVSEQTLPAVVGLRTRRPLKIS